MRMVPQSWGAPWEELSPVEKKLLWLLGLGASWIWRNPLESLVLGYYVRRNPLKGFRLIRLATVETVRYSSRMSWGVAKVMAPETTKKISTQARRLKSRIEKPPDWVRWGGRVSKWGLVTNVIGTGIGMVSLQYERAESGDYGGDVTMSQFITDADMDVSNPGRAPEVRLVPMGGPGGGLVF